MIAYPTDKQMQEEYHRHGAVGLSTQARRKLIDAADNVGIGTRDVATVKNHVAQAQRWLDFLYAQTGGE